MSDPLLSVTDLQVHFETPGGTVRAVDGVSFDVHADETVCLVGESGSGKTVTCRALVGLLDSPRATVRGSVTFDGEELTDRSERELRRYRGTRIGTVAQNSGDALDPVYTVGSQVAEAVRNAGVAEGAAARERALELLAQVGISDPAERAEEYPHELSGGQKQRVLVAVGLAGEPDLLIADEPTTNLDVVTRSSLLGLFEDLQADADLAMLYVTHDFSVVASFVDRVAVTYAGEVVERGPVAELFERPAHPYTQGLLRCLPGRDGVLESIDGTPASAADPPDGCRFHPRCPHAVDGCETGESPPTYDLPDASGVAACVHYGPDGDPATVRDGWEGLAERGAHDPLGRRDRASDEEKRPTEASGEE